MNDLRLRQKSMPTNRRGKPAASWIAASLACFISLAQGEVTINTDWRDTARKYDSEPTPLRDDERLKNAADAALFRRDAVVKNRADDFSWLGRSFKLYLDETKYYLQPAKFMIKTRPDEVCTPIYVGERKYQCSEGQRRISDCHLMFFDAKFAEVGFNTVKVNEPYPFYCNSVVGVGVRAKGGDDVLVTVQYFAIDQKPAGKASDIGVGWNRMTVLFHIKEVDGKIVAEQDDACLGNPNRTDNIPDARKRLAKCAAASALKP